jgi:hypothetical protein
MILYHGSTVKVMRPALVKCRPNTDFGKGFYTTTSLDQAKKWAKLKQQRAGNGNAIVSTFEIDDELFNRTNELEILQFTGPDEKWLNFVTNNRKGNSVTHYDIVFGPVANDRLFATITLFEQGILSVDAAIEQLKTHRLFDQISFNSQKALDYLQYIDMEKQV